MLKKMNLTVIEKKMERRVDIDVTSVILAGYSGRNQEQVKRHIEELRKIGVPAPHRIPVVYKVTPELLTNEEEIVVKSPKTSGEIEYVVLFAGEKKYVTIGSDHTDREIEKIDIQKAKEACPKVIAKEAWIYDEVKDHWDDLVIRSYVLKDEVKRKYQEGTLGVLLDVESLLGDVGLERKKGVALFSGTIPLKEGRLIYADEFEMEILDPKLNRKICHKYKIRRRHGFG